MQMAKGHALSKRDDAERRKDGMLSPESIKRLLREGLKLRREVEEEMEPHLTVAESKLRLLLR